MKKFLSMMAIVALMMTTAVCGDDDNSDDPKSPTNSAWNSVHELSTDAHFTFYPTQQQGIEKFSGYGTIMLYNVQFTIGERVSPKMNIRIDAPVSTQKDQITYSGTDIIPYLIMGSTPTPAEQFVVTNLTATVDTKNKTYSISFDCHGGHFSHQGNVTMAM